jgi:hypothetical protein
MAGMTGRDGYRFGCGLLQAVLAFWLVAFAACAGVAALYWAALSWPAEEVSQPSQERRQTPPPGAGRRR